MVVKKTTKTKKKSVKKLQPKKSNTKKVAAKKRAPAKKTKVSKVVKKQVTKKIANNKSKIAPYNVKKNEKYMSAAMKRHFIAVLLLWKEHLKEEMQKTFDHL